MNCKEFEEFLSAYRDNDLSPDRRKEFTTHMNECKECSDLADNISDLNAILPELSRDIPFFVKNRLYLIGEAVEERTAPVSYAYVKWVAATIGTVILFLNIFYFTNIFPGANKTLHAAVAGIERFVVEAESFIGRIKESNNLFLYNKTETISKTKKKKKKREGKKKDIKGV